MDTATRQVEINEWAYNNKMDTLFVYQLLFIGILTASLIFILKAYGFVGGAFAWYSVSILMLLVVILITNRAYYTRNIRDQRYWSKRNFAPIEGQKAGQDYIDAVRLRYGQSGRGGGASGANCKCP